MALVGASFGGWIALELAIKDRSRLSDLVLIDSVGLHFGAPDAPGVADVFSLSDDEFASLAYADPEKGRLDFAAMSDEQLLVHARNREAAARYAWSPCLHDPKLRQRLSRIRSRTLVLWGDKDRITAPDYGRQLAGEISGSEFELIQGAGHFPHVEKPLQTTSRISEFLSSRGSGVGGGRAAAPAVPLES
jgi:pimeloyl-ACP methyl ester carboxylesterase